LPVWVERSIASISRTRIGHQFDFALELDRIDSVGVAPVYDSDGVDLVGVSWS